MILKKLHFILENQECNLTKLSKLFCTDSAVLLRVHSRPYTGNCVSHTECILLASYC